MRVQLSDGVVELRGAFAATLAFVKALPDRRFDGATKTWTMPLSIRQLGAMRFPDGVSLALAGGDICYGNSRWFSAVELQQGRNAHAAKDAVVAQLAQGQAAAWEALHVWIVAELAAVVPEPLATRLRAVITDDPYALEEGIDRGAVRFSTPAREAQLRAIHAAYWQRATALENERDEAIFVAEERAYDGD